MGDVDTSVVSQIAPHIFITNWNSSSNPEALVLYQIRAVLTACHQLKTPTDRALYAGAGIDHLQVVVDDDSTENIGRFFDQTYDFIQKHVERGENVIVHCAAGVSRSVTLVMNWFIRNWYQGCPELDPWESVNEALNVVRAGRPFAQPNPGFVGQLYEAAKRYNAACQRHLSRSTGNPNPAMSMPPSEMAFAGQHPAHAKPEAPAHAGPGPNIIYLNNEDFDAQGNLVNFAGVNGVVWFFSPGCGHCHSMKPEYEKFAQLLANSPSIRALAVDTSKHRDLMNRIQPQIWGFSVRGVPLVVGYAHGKLFSEYADDDRAKFRTAESLLQYATGLGSAPVERVPA